LTIVTTLIFFKIRYTAATSQVKTAEVQEEIPNVIRASVMISAI